MILIVLYISLFVYMGVIFSLAFSWKRMTSRIPTRKKDTVRTSLLVALRNEATNLSQLLESIEGLKGLNSDFELVFINDHSEDNSMEILLDYKTRSKFKVQVLELEDEIGKKAALDFGIKNSRGELIVVTDADCVFGPNWVSTIINEYQHGAKFISAPVSFIKPNGFWQKLMQLEFLGLIGSGGASVKMGLNLMANGANMAFEKSAYNSIRKIKEGQEKASGDDVYTLSAFSKKYPNQISFVKNRDAIVYTKYEPSLKQFIQQRIRWASKGAGYLKFSSKLMTILIFFSNLLILLAPFFMPWNKLGAVSFIALLLCKWLIDRMFYANILPFFQERKLLNYVLIAQIFHIPYLVFTAIFASFSSYHWKGRKTK